jgi:hypothetical protein
MKAEDKWVKILSAYVSKDKARQITIAVFADPRLTISEPCDDEIIQIVEENLEILIENSRNHNPISESKDELIKAVKEHKISR